MEQHTEQDHHQQIRYPAADDGDRLLNELGLDALPSKEQLRETIEKQWLSPKDVLPEHWLSRYQV